jgi:hypothetical protein
VDAFLPILLVIVVGGLVITVAVLAHKANQKRQLALLELAQKFGLHFDPEGSRPEGMHSLFAHFKSGHSQRIFNTFRGELPLFARPCPCILGDFEYKQTSGSGKDRRTTTHHFSYLIVCLPWIVPNLTLRREHVFDKIAGALGFDDIDFESERFSRAFHVKCKDKKFAYDVIHPRMMEFLLGANPTPVAFAGPWCCISDGSRRWTPEQFRGQIEFAQAFFGHWPEHLTRELESRTAADGMKLS